MDNMVDVQYSKRTCQRLYTLCNPLCRPAIMSSPRMNLDFDSTTASLPDGRVAGEINPDAGHGHSEIQGQRQCTPAPECSPRRSPIPIPVGTPHQPHIHHQPHLHLSSSAPTTPNRPMPAAQTHQGTTATTPIHSHLPTTTQAISSPPSVATPFRATLTNDHDEDYAIDADDEDNLGDHGYDSDAMADDEGDDDRGAGGNSSDELMMMDSDDPDDDPMDDEDDDDGLEVIYNGLARDSNRSRLSLVHGLDASRSRNPSEVELVVISDDDETFARVDQTQVEQVLDKLREGADEDEEGQIDDDILFVGETFDTSNKRNKVDFLSWDFQDDRLAQVRPPPSEFGPLLPSDDLGPQSPRGSRRTRNRRGSRRARSASPMATPRARSRSRSAVLGDDVQAGRGHAGQAPARFNKLQWSQEVAEHPNKYELAMLGDFIKVLFMLPLLDEKQKGQQIQLAPGPLQPVLQNIQQLIRTHVSSDDEQIKAFHNYLSTLGLDSVIPIRSRVPISKFNLELLPLLPRTLTRPIPLLIPTFLQTQELVDTFSAHPHLYLVNAFHRAGRPAPANVPIPQDILPRYLSVDMPPDYNHRLYKVPNGTHAGMAFESHEVLAVTSDFDMLRAINEGREPATMPANSLWVPPSNYAASSSATRAKRGDERFDTVVAMVAMALGIYGREYDVPFVIVVSPFNHDLRNLRYAMHARNILTVCLETVEEFVCLDRWLRLWCKLAGTAAQPVAAGE